MKLRRFIVDVLTCVALLAVALGAVDPEVDVLYVPLISGASVAIGLMVEPQSAPRKTPSSATHQARGVFALGQAALLSRDAGVAIARPKKLT
jgi:hypothetical protein